MYGVGETERYCALCGTTMDLTTHHLLWPKEKWKNHPKRHLMVSTLCRPCHEVTHRILSRTNYDNWQK